VPRIPNPLPNHALVAARAVTRSAQRRADRLERRGAVLSARLDLMRQGLDASPDVLDPDGRLGAARPIGWFPERKRRKVARAHGLVMAELADALRAVRVLEARERDLERLAEAGPSPSPRPSPFPSPVSPSIAPPPPIIPARSPLYGASHVPATEWRDGVWVAGTSSGTVTGRAGKSGEGESSPSPRFQPYCAPCGGPCGGKEAAFNRARTLREKITEAGELEPPPRVREARREMRDALNAALHACVTGGRALADVARAGVDRIARALGILDSELTRWRRPRIFAAGGPCPNTPEPKAGDLNVAPDGNRIYRHGAWCSSQGEVEQLRAELKAAQAKISEYTGALLGEAFGKPRKVTPKPLSATARRLRKNRLARIAARNRRDARDRARAERTPR